ncbi:hypothetical protein ACIBI9_26825 [Nonomuraea sp. NPDC050451]|uniref:hypothetical protein n=1 Tax=Nonomuraea sp. NPDC050451 TaxID=3364364 RepID=UPI0037B79795
MNRIVKRAMAREKVKRNVVELCTLPKGRGDRPSRSLTFQQALAILSASTHHRMHPYIVVPSSPEHAPKNYVTFAGTTSA